jgi:hypothetical protein
MNKYALYITTSNTDPKIQVHLHHPMSAVLDIKDTDTDPQKELPNYALLHTNHKNNK